MSNIPEEYLETRRVGNRIEVVYVDTRDLLRDPRVFYLWTVNDIISVYKRLTDSEHYPTIDELDELIEECEHIDFGYESQSIYDYISDVVSDRIPDFDELDRNNLIAHLLEE